MDEFYRGQKVHCKRNGDGVVTAASDAYEDYLLKQDLLTDTLKRIPETGRFSKAPEKFT